MTIMTITMIIKTRNTNDNSNTHDTLNNDNYDNYKDNNKIIISMHVIINIIIIINIYNFPMRLKGLKNVLLKSLTKAWLEYPQSGCNIISIYIFNILYFKQDRYSNEKKSKQLQQNTKEKQYLSELKKEKK